MLRAASTLAASSQQCMLVNVQSYSCVSFILKTFRTTGFSRDGVTIPSVTEAAISVGLCITSCAVFHLPHLKLIKIKDIIQAVSRLLLLM